jgi:uncharacterized protein (TIGR02145 family)
MRNNLTTVSAENFQPQHATNPENPKIGVIGVRIILAAILWLALAFTLSCDAANPSALVGRWVGVSGDDKGDVMELLSDGTGIAGKYAITWKTEKSRFYVTALGRAEAVSYKLQSSQLTFTKDNGNVSVYAKCKKDCQETIKEYVRENNKKYKSVKIGNKIWMSENSNYATEGSKCYGNDESNCQKYGRLYNWKAALKACPIGWHLPSDAEWQTLVDFAGGSEAAGQKLKAKSGWNSYDNGESGNGTDDYGFSALPGGSGDSDGDFGSVGGSGDWWSSTEYYAPEAYYRYMTYDFAYVNRYINDKSRYLSVRCLQD